MTKVFVDASQINAHHSRAVKRLGAFCLATCYISSGLRTMPPDVAIPDTATNDSDMIQDQYEDFG